MVRFQAAEIELTPTQMAALGVMEDAFLTLAEGQTRGAAPVVEMPRSTRVYADRHAICYANGFSEVGPCTVELPLALFTPATAQGLRCALVLELEDRPPPLRVRAALPPPRSP